MEKFWLFFVFSVLLNNISYSQKMEKPDYYNTLTKERSDLLFNRALRYSLGGNSYNFMALRNFIDANNQAFLRGNNSIISLQLSIIDNLMKSSKPSKNIKGNKYKYKDDYKGWIAERANEKNKSSIGQEVPLFESYTFFSVAQFLYLLKEKGWVDVSDKNKAWWHESVKFLETNIWTKWQNRSIKIYGKPNRLFLRNRVHIGSHWAGIAMYLNKISDNAEIQRRTKQLQKDYDLLLKNNLRSDKNNMEGIIWNRTYDESFDTDAVVDSQKVIQDVSHGNHVVSYIIASYELDKGNWPIDIIHKLANTAKKLIYVSNSNSFKDNVDGSNIGKGKGTGNFVGDGWLKLAKYDKELNDIFINFSKKQDVLHSYNQELQFKSTLQNSKIQ